MQLVLPRAATPAARRRVQAVIGVLFAVVATGMALVRFRCSPLYPALNDVNSDVYVYQMLGNSWAHGLLPYRDVYDVKGPALYLLFRLFAWVRPWSMGPPFATLALLAFASLWLAYAIAVDHLRRRPLAALAAVVSCVVVYVSVTTVPTSFTCEELAVPGVLLLLWLVSRWLSGRDKVADRWWVVDGVVFGLLFWSKYQVIAPWVAMLLALTVLVARKGLPFHSLRRVVALHAAGAAAATAAILACYVPDLPDMVRAYFLAKRGNLNPAHELVAEGAFAATIFRHNTAAALALLGVLLLLVRRAADRGRRDGLVLAVAFCLSLWASVALVRHTNNLFVPLSFVAVTVPHVLSVAQARGHNAVRAAGAVATVLATSACVFPLVQGVAVYGLLRHPRPLTCYDLPGLARHRTETPISTVFARTAGNSPILSVGTLFAARTSYVSQLPARHPLEFVDASWSRNIGADRVQARYLRDRTFDYAWIHIKGVNRFHYLKEQIAAATYTNGPSQPQQAAALVHNYVPVMACNNDILLRAR